MRLFTVSSSTTFAVLNLTLADGMARGTDGGPGINGGPGQGGAIYCTNGTIDASNCVFIRNTAQGGDGGATNGFPSGNGGVAQGGALYVANGFLNATNCIFAMNASLGGVPGAVATAPSSITIGGDAFAGAIFDPGTSMQLVGCQVLSNRAVGGPGRRFNVAGASSGGTAYGGAFYPVENLWLIRSTVSANSNVAGAIGSAFGGAFYVNGSLHVIESVLSSNTATGGRIASGSGSALPGRISFGGAIHERDRFGLGDKPAVSADFPVGRARIPDACGFGNPR